VNDLRDITAEETVGEPVKALLQHMQQQPLKRL
jgi:hypothetical protein